jgi:hypothetical protein
MQEIRKEVKRKDEGNQPLDLRMYDVLTNMERWLDDAKDGYRQLMHTGDQLIVNEREKE